MPNPIKKTISATESPALFNASPYVTRWMLWQKFANGIDIEKVSTSRMDWGKKIQPLIIEQVAEERKLEIIPNTDTYVRRGLLGCTRDGTIIDPQRGPGALEIKCVFDYNVWATKWKGGQQVQREVEIQLQQQMLVGDGSDRVGWSGSYQWGLICVWVCADLYYFERSPVTDLWSKLETEATKFFISVETRIEPDPFGVILELPFITKMFPTVPDKIIDLSNDPDHVKTTNDLSMYAHLKSESSGAAVGAEDLRVKLLVIARDAEQVRLPCGASYRVRKSGKGKTIVPYIPDVPTAPPPSKNIMQGW